LPEGDACSGKVQQPERTSPTVLTTSNDREHLDGHDEVYSIRISRRSSGRRQPDIRDRERSGIDH
jgi:hypothetical protein